ncbi:hypothetical protein OOT33_00225 [Sphingobium sp. DEHP117]|uniref:hypothetical protein n=1 Tax=Sphingobium sp. DEHP117 TaxID=2993436 RepID=UPI0027D52519|nr:hypothetical protein [Sphingobium sp. DEHP117]MDQ4418872.1 hypothetical protein [Sphingobium sp. DEHP117]
MNNSGFARVNSIMKQHFSPARPAIAAIAAVIAIPSTAALAQTVDAAPPVIIAPTAEPAAPAPAQTAPAPAATPQVIFQPSSPVVQPTPPAPTVAADTAEEAAPAERPAARSATKVAPARVTPAERQAATPPAPSTARSVTEAPVSPVQSSPPPIQTTAPQPEPAASSTPTPALPEDGSSDTALWLLGLGALGVVAAGSALAARRNRRDVVEPVRSGDTVNAREEFVEVDPAQRFAMPGEAIAEERLAPAPYVEPVISSRPTPEPTRAGMPARALAREVDGSAASRDQREAMAAAAPSAENPFLTRKNRLRRADFLLSRSNMDRPQADAAIEANAEAWDDERQKGEVASPQQVSYSFGNSGALKPPVLKPRYN